MWHAQPQVGKHGSSMFNQPSISHVSKHLAPGVRADNLISQMRWACVITLGKVRYMLTGVLKLGKIFSGAPPGRTEATTVKAKNPLPGVLGRAVYIFCQSPDVQSARLWGRRLEGGGASGVFARSWLMGGGRGRGGGKIRPCPRRNGSESFREVTRGAEARCQVLPQMSGKLQKTVHLSWWGSRNHGRPVGIGQCGGSKKTSSPFRQSIRYESNKFWFMGFSKDGGHMQIAAKTPPRSGALRTRGVICREASASVCTNVQLRDHSGRGAPPRQKGQREVGGGRAGLVVVSLEIGGRWSTEAATLLRCGLAARKPNPSHCSCALPLALFRMWPPSPSRFHRHHHHRWPRTILRRPSHPTPPRQPHHKPSRPPTPAHNCKLISHTWRLASIKTICCPCTPGGLPV